MIGPAQAGGFALIEHGVTGLGNAYAGAAAVAGDTSTIWFNPAGMTELDGRETAIAVHVIDNSTDWDDRGTALNPAFDRADDGQPAFVSGADSASPGTVASLPNFYYSAPFGERWRYGLGIGVPFGSATEYDEDWKGRYTTIESGVNVIDINPSLAYRLSDRVRLGAGLSVQFLNVELVSAIDSSAACFGSVGRVEPGACLAAGLGDFGNQALDSRGKISGDSTAFSFNLGALFLPRPDTRIGVAYRHGVDHEIDDGEGDFTVNPTLRAVLDAAGAQSDSGIENFLSDSGASAELDLPPTFMLSAAHELNDRVELLADVTWTGWSSFQELRVEYDNPVQPDVVSLQEWEDVLRYSAGVNFRVNERLTLRTGIALDEEPIPSPERRTARIPGNDRTWFSIGAGYDFGERLTLDVGYSYLDLPKTAIDNAGEESPGASTVRGVYDTSIDIFGAQLSWHFD